ncbi:sensor histidine kinase [Sagittula sp. SSi028]|uniref:sensor histidine kinase n=1 Tax=Sagittula sp. SSi028 TaxID=3400636 RepID=UPI003AF43158
MVAMHSIRWGGPALILAAFVTGAASASMWLGASHRWQAHLVGARHTGEILFDTLTTNAPAPNGITVQIPPPPVQRLAHAGEFERAPAVPRPALVTQLTLRHAEADALTSGAVKLAVVSSALRYPLSELDTDSTATGRDTMGAVVALLATYCSDAVIFATVTDGSWRVVSGPDVWGCHAKPGDSRLGAVLLALIALGMLYGATTGVSARFTGFAEQLRSKKRVGGADPFVPHGPAELRALIGAVNDYREVERAHLAERALVLSGVSHDLGTPATRLKLRAALIADDALRHKFEADIDQMTGIIESVLTYTRAELNTEEPRRISLMSLVETVVDDYRDIGSPVVFGGSARVVIEGGHSIFMSRRSHTEIGEDVQLVLPARPIALQRALSNLIDNALKYGRRAEVRVETDADQVHVLIEDEGARSPDVDLDQMKAPFRRGTNATPIKGFGMGLTIASTIAIEHGGQLSFEPGRTGWIARLSLPRGWPEL